GDIADARGQIEALPPLLATHPEVSPKPGALLLLAGLGEPAAPVLVVGRFGQGQTAALCGFPIWRWGLTDREPLRHAMGALSSNLVRWLTQPREVRQVQIASAKSVYENGESAEFF